MFPRTLDQEAGSANTSALMQKPICIFPFLYPLFSGIDWFATDEFATPKGVIFVHYLAW